VIRGLECVQRIERRLASSFDLGHIFSGIHAEPFVLREQRHDMRDSVHRPCQEGACVRVGREVQTAPLQLVQLMSGAVDLARETHDKAVGSPDRRL
jgi:hypothetical protein